MAQSKANVPDGYITIPKFTSDLKQRARLYRLVREHRLKKGKDYKIIVRRDPLILVRKDLEKEIYEI